MASDWEGVSVALAGTMFDATPTWTRLDSGIDGLKVASIEIERGRSSVFEQTDTGRCRVTFRDTAGYLDPTFSASIISKPFAVAIRNPVTDEWWPQFRGVVDDVQFVMNHSTVKLDVVVEAVDMFDYFANYELIPGLAGFAGAPNAAGYVFYEDAGFDERVLAILGDANIGSAFYSVFTGNIIVSESIYASGDRVLQALREAVEAEFPTVAAMYVDRRGRVQIHGRYARFDPDTVSASATNWDFARWKVGDIPAAVADPGATGTAKMQEPYVFGESRADIRNAALCYPQYDLAGNPIDQADLDDFVYTDETSRDAHGTRTWTAPNLQVAEETTIGMTGKEFCLLVSEYIVENYKNPVPMIPSVTVGTEDPEGTFGAASWAYICGADISDVVTVTINHAGGGGFSDDYYIEGVRVVMHYGPGSLDNSYPIIKHSVDLSSSSHWTHNPFGAMPT